MKKKLLHLKSITMSVIVGNLCGTSSSPLECTVTKNMNGIWNTYNHDLPSRRVLVKDPVKRCKEPKGNLKIKYYYDYNYYYYNYYYYY